MANTRTATRKRPDRYDSPAMAERRSLILETARTMLANDEKITMRALAEKSGVVLATLYNIFGNQENLIAESVMEVFDDILVHPWEGVQAMLHGYRIGRYDADIVRSGYRKNLDLLSMKLGDSHWLFGDRIQTQCYPVENWIEGA